MENPVSKSKTYNIHDKASGDILAADVKKDDVEIVESTLIDIGYEVIVSETASAGSTGAGSIAVNMDNGKGKSLKDFMKTFNSRIKNSFKPFTVKVTEGFDMESVFSRLSSMEKAGSQKKTEGTTFGVEDDEGNIMKVTVRSDQAEAFEAGIAQYLADIKLNVVGMPSPKGATEVSMAELLFKLKDTFDIIDVDFPKIPGDVIYNADKATDKIPDTGMGDDMGMGDLDMEGEQPDDLSQPLDLTDYKEPDQDEGGDLDLDAEMSELGDAEGVEDFPEDMEPSEDSILDKVIDMLKAQAAAETEKARAEAEKARADQARYTAMAQQAEIDNQEDALRYELEMEAEKKKEKEANKMMDMAKHKLSRAMGMREGDERLNEYMSSEPSNFIQKERQSIQQQFEILPDDDQDTKVYKTKQKQEALRILGARYRFARNQEAFERLQKIKKAEATKNQQKNPQQNQQQPTQQQNQQTGQQANQQQSGQQQGAI